MAKSVHFPSNSLPWRKAIIWKRIVIMRLKKMGQKHLSNISYMITIGSLICIYLAPCSFHINTSLYTLILLLGFISLWADFNLGQAVETRESLEYGSCKESIYYFCSPSVAVEAVTNFNLHFFFFPSIFRANLTVCPQVAEALRQVHFTEVRAPALTNSFWTIRFLKTLSLLLFP